MATTTTMLPQSWDDIKMGAYANYLTSKEEPEERLSQLSGVDYAEWKELPGNQVAGFLQLLKTQPTAQRSLRMEIDGTTVTVPASWSDEDFHFGTLIDMEEARKRLGENATLRLLAIASVRQGKAGYSTKDVDERERLLQNAPVSAVWPLVNFYVSAGKTSAEDTLTSTELLTRSKLEEGYKKAEELSSMAAGLGFSWKRSAVETRLRSVRQYLNQLASSVST